VFYTGRVTVAAALPITPFSALRRAAYLPLASGPPSFRLVLPRNKRDRLAARVASLRRHRACGVSGCQAEGMPVMLVDSELEALLCPVHLLVLPDGSSVEGEPMLATGAW
jgi:hypothetical protein